MAYKDVCRILIDNRALNLNKVRSLEMMGVKVNSGREKFPNGSINESMGYSIHATASKK